MRIMEYMRRAWKAATRSTELHVRYYKTNINSVESSGFRGTLMTSTPQQIISPLLS
jgi:hypothetical protein